MKAKHAAARSEAEGRVKIKASRTINDLYCVWVDGHQARANVVHSAAKRLRNRFVSNLERGMPYDA